MDAVVTALKPKDYEVHDTLRDGLRLCVNPGGTKSWTLFYIATAATVAAASDGIRGSPRARARERAAEALGRIKGPERADPAQEIVVQRSAPPFGELAALVLESQHFATRTQKTQKELSRVVEVDLLPESQSWRLSTIDRQEIQRWGDRIVSEIERTWRTGAANTCS
jgi:hypothetical protein